MDVRPRDLDVVVRLAAEAEQLGFDSFWTIDHVLPIGGYLSFLGEQQADCLITLAAVAAATRNMSIGTAALVAGLRRQPVVMAQLRSLAELSRGRLVVGLAAGWNRTEFEQVGADFSERARRCDEVITALRGLPVAIPILLAGGPVRGDHANLGGAGWRQSWLRRLSRCDGWLVRPQSDPATVREGMRQLAVAGFKPPERLAHVNFIAFEDGQPSIKKLAGHLGSSTDSVADFWIQDRNRIINRIREMLDSGVSEIIAHITECTPDDLRAWARICEQVQGVRRTEP